MLAINSQEEGDYLSVGNNLAGCNSIEEVVDSCDVSRFAVGDLSDKIFESKRKADFSLSRTGEAEFLNQFEVHPNPFDNSVMVKSNNKLGSAKIQLFDIRGAMILSDIITTTEKN